MSDEPVVTETEFEETPAQVWRALTEPDLVDRWLPQSPLVPTDREVVQSDPQRSLRVVWRGPEVESDVAFELIETKDGGTRLRVVHNGFRRPTSNLFKMAA